MSENNLSESEWKKFAKGKSLKDTALVKALAALEQAKDDAPRQLAALDDIDKQADALKKANKADKALQDYLGDLDKALNSQRKLAQAQARKAAAAPTEPESEDSPEILTTRMLPLFRQVRNGEAFPVMLASTGKHVAVLISRRTISPATRKVMAQYLQDQWKATGTPKYLPGQCLFEANTHTFVMQSQAAGLAKKVKAALLAQTGLNLKIRVRGEDPNDVDEALDEGSEQATATADPPAPTAPPAPAEQPAIMARLAALQPAIKSALTGPLGAQIKALVAAVGEALKAQKAPLALQAIERLEALTRPSPPAAAPTQPDPAPEIRKGTVDYAKCRLAWEAARKKVHADLQALEAAVLKEYQDSRAFGQLQVNIRRFDQVLAGFAEDLGDLLDNALNASDPKLRQQHHAQAATVVAKFLDRASQDPFIAKLQTNPFVPLTIQTSLVNTLQALAQRLN